MQTTNYPPSIGSPDEAYESAIKLLNKHRPNNILDCPAGHGAFAGRLLDAGFKISCCDILPNTFHLKNVTCDFADLNIELPYSDNSFNAVVCLNGLHRIWARGRAMAEFSRVLEPEGLLILTFCNAANMIHRLLYFLSGVPMIDMVGPPMTQQPNDNTPAASFRFPLTVNHVASLAKHTGMEIIEINSCNLSIKSLLLSPLALGPMMFKLVAPQAYQEIARIKEGSKLHALFSDYTIIALKKTLP